MGKSLSFIDPGLSAITSGDPSNADPFDLLGTKAGKAAQEAQKNQNQSERDLKIAFANQAREDLFDLFPSAQANRELGMQGAFDTLGSTIPQQFGAIRQGNVGAQQALLAGLPQIQNAILGRHVDLSGLQPTSIGVDTGFSQQQVPEFSLPLLGDAAVEAQIAAEEEEARLAKIEADRVAQQNAPSAASLASLSQLLGGINI